MHVGYYKGLLRYMVGITVPDDRDGVWLTVNGATRHWAEGFDFLWDDTYPHAVYNTTNQTRIILYMDVERTVLPWLGRVLNNFLLTLLKSTGIAEAEISKTETVARL